MKKNGLKIVTIGGGSSYTPELMNGFISQLDDDKRAVFIRRYMFGESAAEIAKKYGYSETKVRSMLFRTRNKLKKYLEGKDVQL